MGRRVKQRNGKVFMISKLFLRPPNESKMGLMLEREQYSQLVNYVCEASIRNYEETLDCLSQAIKASWESTDEIIRSILYADPYGKNINGFSRECAKNRVKKLERKPNAREVAEVTLQIVERKRKSLKEVWAFIDFFGTTALGAVTLLFVFLVH